MDSSRRRLCLGLAGALASMLAAQAGVAKPRAKAKPNARVIKIEAKKFAFTPNHIVLKKGEAVVLELRALDFTHGFNIPDMKIRSDLLAGQVTRIALQPQTAGEFAFLCDNFCGSGHEEMNGSITVTA
jgi:cytochrome c oxidase subunit II